VDSLTAFACWIVFGPPFTAFIASNFDVSLYQLISQNYLNFLILLFLTYIYFINVGFYSSSIYNFYTCINYYSINFFF